MKLSVCVNDADYEAWRAIRIAVVPSERCDTVAELRAQDSSSRLLLLADLDGTVAAPASPTEPRVVVAGSQHHVCGRSIGAEVLADFAVHTPLEISADQWNTSWPGDVMFLPCMRAM